MSTFKTHTINILSMATDKNDEVGYQTLGTTFTGRSAQGLSGNNIFQLVDFDAGVAKTQESTELKRIL